MAAERWLLGLSLLPAALGAAPLASASKLSFGDGGSDALPAAEAPGLRRSFELPFTLSRSAKVLAQAEGLRHIDQGPNAAPEAFIDEQFLGPLRSEHGQAWRSARAVELGPGQHRLLLRNARVADAEDFVLERIFVYAIAPAGAGPKAPVQAPEAQARPEAENGCAERRRDWPAHLKGGITLSVLSGQLVSSKELVRLKQGQAWACGLKVTGQSSKPLALLAGFHPLSGDQGAWVMSLDPEPPPAFDETGFKSARWERFQVELCGGNLAMRFGQNPPLRVPWPNPEISFEIAAQSVEVSLRPLP